MFKRPLDELKICVDNGGNTKTEVRVFVKKSI